MARARPRRRAWLGGSRRNASTAAKNAIRPIGPPCRSKAAVAIMAWVIGGRSRPASANNGAKAGTTTVSRIVTDTTAATVSNAG